MKQSEIIDLAKQRTKAKLDEDLAEMLGIDQSTVSRLRNGRQNFGPELALKVADAAGIDPREVVAAAMAARCKDEDARKRWEEMTPDPLRIMCRKTKKVPLFGKEQYLKAA